jgi:hypothetical protein
VTAHASEESTIEGLLAGAEMRALPAGIRFTVVCISISV